VVRCVVTITRKGQAVRVHVGVGDDDDDDDVNGTGREKRMTIEVTSGKTSFHDDVKGKRRMITTVNIVKS
jgi:hypothetical protein